MVNFALQAKKISAPLQQHFSKKKYLQMTKNFFKIKNLALKRGGAAPLLTTPRRHDTLPFCCALLKFLNIST